MAGLVKIIGYIVLFAFVIGGGFYLGIVTGLGPTVLQINNDFWAFVPVEFRIFLGLLVFSLLIGLLFTFIN